MEKYKYLVKNIGLLTIANFTTKFLQFFLVPLYTAILTTSDYGIYDLFNTSIGVLLPILTLNIQEAVIRFALDRKYNSEIILTIGMRIIIASNILVILGVLINEVVEFSIIISQYGLCFFLMYFTQSLSGVITCYIRGIDRIAELSISSVISTMVTIALNIFFLIVFQWGLVGYFLASIIGPLVQCVYLVVRNQMIGQMHLIQNYSLEQSEMLEYTRPLIVNAVAWWINNASDRYVIIFTCGLEANGIYSVASKIPSLLNIFQTIFNQAWTLSTVKEFDPEDSSGFFANTYKAYNCMMTIMCSVIIVFDKILAKFLYAKDFYLAWRYVPWLTIAILFGAMSGYIGGFFAAVKDSRIFAVSTVLGAITNIVMNIVLIPIMGPLGAAIATAISYVEVFIFRYIQSKKYIRLRINLVRDVISYILLVIQACLLLIVSNNIILFLIEMGLFVFIVFLHFQDLKVILNKFINAD